MKTMPWRILVLTEVGTAAGRPTRVAPGGVDAWLESVGATVEVAPAAGSPSRRLALQNRASFAPRAIVAGLGTEAGAGEVDAALHAPAVQRLESAWRGLELLLEHAGEEIPIEVLSIPRKNLAARFREVVFGPELERKDQVALILADYDFSHHAEDLTVLEQLAGMAKVLQAPLVASASAGFFDLRYLIQATALPDLLARLGDSAHTAWRSFQASEAARWVTLTINRYLQRPPYAAEGDGHAESVSESKPDTYLWGRGVWLVGAAVARSVRTRGHALDLSGMQGGRFTGLPTRSYTAATTATPVALAGEAALAEMQVLELSRAAFTPVVAPLRSDTVLLPMVVTTFRLTPGKLTLEGTLAYQLTAARLARACGDLLDSVPAAGPEEVAGYFKRELTEILGTLAGDASDVVTAEVQEVKMGDETVPVAAIQIRPAVKLEGKALEFAFELPLRSV